MQWPTLTEGVLIKRYKRFLADIDFGGRTETVHCPNPGAMTGLKSPGMRVWCSTSLNPKRKLPKTLEIVEADGTLVGINTNLPNKLALEALQKNQIPKFAQYQSITPEFTYQKGTRFDFKLQDTHKKTMLLEVKNVHLLRTPNAPKPAAEFPDAITQRGTKHLKILAEVARNGTQAAMLYVVQREDAKRFTLADDIDPEYAQACSEAQDAGVIFQAWQCRITLDAIDIHRPLPMTL